MSDVDLHVAVSRNELRPSRTTLATLIRVWNSHDELGRFRGLSSTSRNVHSRQ